MDGKSGLRLSPWARPVVCMKGESFILQENSITVLAGYDIWLPLYGAVQMYATSPRHFAYI